MTLPSLRTPHGRLVSVHNGRTLAWLARQKRVVDAAQALAYERMLFATDDLELLSPAERDLRDALTALGEEPT